MQADKHLRETYPRLLYFFDVLGPIEIPKSTLSVPEAVVRIIVGQMLSRTAARAIYQRLVNERDIRKLTGTWCLEEAILRECGLSIQKRRTIAQFAEIYKFDPMRIEMWNDLDPEALIKEVRSFWGMSDWTAAMLAIFQFSHEDFFPWSDNSIIRATKLVELHIYRTKCFEPDNAAPYRTRLALYLWKSLDTGYWNFRKV